MALTNVVRLEWRALLSAAFVIVLFALTAGDSPAASAGCGTYPGPTAYFSDVQATGVSCSAAEPVMDAWGGATRCRSTSTTQPKTCKIRARRWTCTSKRQAGPIHQPTWRGGCKRGQKRVTFRAQKLPNP